MTTPSARPGATAPCADPDQPGQHPYARLTPQRVLDALETCGLRGDGRVLTLNSYENRVFQVCLEDGSRCVAKFYRPGRWSPAQLLEEHRFATELDAAELPVVAPWRLAGHDAEGQVTAVPSTLHSVTWEGTAFFFAVYPCRSGRAPELEQAETLRWAGRFLARLHQVGARAPFVHRPTLSPESHGHRALARVLALDVVPAAECAPWQQAAAQALAAVDDAWQRCAARTLRLHGDCHPGNILWRHSGDALGPGGPQIVDLDDAMNGPAIQDLWMLLSGERSAMAWQLAQLLSGYRQLRALDLRELSLIEPLRTLRLLHHSAWLAERWTDPAFPAAFPWFGSPAYWGQQTVLLREQIAAMAEAPLTPDDLAGLADDVGPVGAEPDAI